MIEPILVCPLPLTSFVPTMSLLSGSAGKNPPAMQGTVQSLGQEDPLEKEMATHSSILAWEIPWTEEPGKLQSMGSQKSDATEGLHNNNVTSRVWGLPHTILALCVQGGLMEEYITSATLQKDNVIT